MSASTRRAPSVIFAVALGVAVVCSACGGDSAPKVRVIEQPEQFGFRHARIDPLPPGTEGLLTSDRLLELHPPRQPRDVELLLGSYTDLDLQVFLPGQPSRVLDHRPVWIVVEKNVPIAQSGPPDQPHHDWRGDFLTVYDAHDGKALIEFDGPTGGYSCPIDPNAERDHCKSVERSD